MIRVHNIHKSFDTLEVLKGIDLEISEGEIVSIMGPSGAGKTTLLQIIGTLDSSDRGNVWLNNRMVGTMNDKETANLRNQLIGFVFQFHQLLPEFTALENVMIPGLIAGKSEQKVSRKAKELLKYLKLEGRLQHKPGELSGGEKQRVAVARALINDPKIMLADEPSGSLDSQNKVELHNLLLELREKFGLTIVIVTHDRELASLSDRIVEMKDGKIIS